MLCEHCGKPIKDGEKFYWTADEVTLHEKCYPREQFIADVDRYVQGLGSEETRKWRETK